MAGPPKAQLAQEQQGKSSRPPTTAGSTSASSSGHGSRSIRSINTGVSHTQIARSGRGYDGNADPSTPTTERNPNAARVEVIPKNFDLGLSGWSVVRGTDVATTLPKRGAPSKLGTATKVGLNTYHVESFPNIPVFQYDVMIDNGLEKRGVITKVWNSKAVRDAMGGFVVFDGNKLAWSGKSIDREIRLDVDLDAEQGRKPGRNGPDVHRVCIRQTNKVGFQQLLSHLQGKAAFDNTCLEAINFADQLLRMNPSQNFTAIKRNFFKRGENRFDLTGGIEAFKGVYQSLRIVHPGRLSVNVDVANGTFWRCLPLTTLAIQMTGANSAADLASRCSGDPPLGGEKSRWGRELKRLRKVRVIARHRGKATADEYCIEKLIYQDAKKYMVSIRNDSGKMDEMSIYDFFRRKYNVLIQYPLLPLCKMTKGEHTVLPMDVLTVKENQRYPYKMDEKQTSNMIKFAVTAPPQRYAHIQEGINMLDWANDPYLKKYGVKINPNKTTVDGRVLPAPIVKFGAGEAKPGTSGRWDLKGKKMLMGNPVPLKSWAVCVITGRRGGKPDKTTVENFIKAFVQGYIAHGGKVENKQPSMSLGTGDDVGAWVTTAWNAAGNQSQSRPQILFFILPDKDPQVYGRIKRSCECRYGVVSQCIQYAHAVKAQPQYISNVCMKFNCKLGGATCRAVGPKTGGPTGIFSVPTMIIGADVSHSAPGVQAPSMAAMTVSTDKLATRYAAVVQANGYRVEMINPDIINNELKPMIAHWMQQVGNGKVPQQIIYLRDGVSEGQYHQVLSQEVADMKALIKTADPGSNVKFLVIIGSKRHHVRFFPEKGDKNGNPFPGTLVESGVTNPFENDFYLCSHAAIKGTARPVHYYVLMNEPNMSNDQIHTLLYEHAYQYQRASTPVSQHPAIYYAHLAAARAAPHDPKWAGSSDGPSGSKEPKHSTSKSGSQAGKSNTRGSSAVPKDYDMLLPMPNQGGINTSMWYI